MSRDRKWLIDLIAAMLNSAINPGVAHTEAEMIVDRLQEEGVLHLGYGDADIDIITDTFKELFGTTKTTHPDRWAARRLSSKYGARSVVGIMQILAANAQEQYAPVVGSVAELEQKWVKVLNFVRKQSSTDEVIETP